MYLKGRNGYFFKSFCQILNYRNLKMCDVRLNDNIKRTSGINLEGPSLIRRSWKVWAPPPKKKWSNCANDSVGAAPMVCPPMWKPYFLVVFFLMDDMTPSFPYMDTVLNIVIKYRFNKKLRLLSVLVKTPYFSIIIPSEKYAK